MKIEQQSPDALIIHDSAWLMRGLGLVFAGSGIGLLALMPNAAGRSIQGSAWVGWAVGGAFAIIGVALALTAADRHYAFYRHTSMVRVTVRGLLKRQIVEYPFAAIKDVVLESSSSLNARPGSSAMFRVVFLMRDGTREAWTPYSTSDVTGQGACAAAARSFGGWEEKARVEGASPAAGSAATVAPPASSTAAVTAAAALASATAATSVLAPATSPRPSPIFPAQGARVQNLGCVMAFLAIFVAVGLGLFGLEVYRISTWQPVRATVLASDIQAVRGNKGTSYKPVVSYRYAVGARQFVGTGVLPVTISSSYGWAQSLQRRFVPGTSVTAYYDPQKPWQAFLVHDVSFLPLLFVAFPLLMAGLMTWMVRMARRQAVFTESPPVPVVPAEPRLVLEPSA